LTLILKKFYDGVCASSVAPGFIWSCSNTDRVAYASVVPLAGPAIFVCGSLVKTDVL